MIIGITGTLGAGKGSVVDILKKKGFKHYSVRGFLIEEIKKRNLPINRDTMVSVANQLREINGSSFIIEKLYEQAKNDKYAIIESIRTIGEAEKIKELGGFLIAVDADPQKRYSRVIIRQSETDNISFEKFLEDEKREIYSANPNEQNLSQCRNLADFIITNDKTLDFLEKKVEEIIYKIQSIKTSEKKDFLEKDKDSEEIKESQEEIKETQKRKDYISWDDYFMGVAVLSSLRSKDPNTQVGACIVDKKNHIVATGYNGFPIGCSDDELSWNREGPKIKTKYPYVVHAEQNAITNATKDLENCRIYIPLFPCNECAKLIIQSRIKEVIYISDKYSEIDEFKVSRKLLNMAGIKLKQLTPENAKILIDFNKLI